jgi:tetratricopeptide (TPR) repeat protein
MRIICLIALLFSLHIGSVTAQESPSDKIEVEKGSKKKREKKSKDKKSKKKSKKRGKDKEFDIDDLINNDYPSTLAPATDSSFSIKFDEGEKRDAPKGEIDFDDLDKKTTEENFGNPDTSNFFTGDLSLEERRKYDDEKRRAPIPDKIPKINRTEFLKGENAFKKQEYDEALNSYLVAAKPYHTGNASLNYHIGRSYLNSRLEDRTKAVLHFQKAIKNTHKKAKSFKFNEDRAPLDAYFYLAKAYQLDYRLEEANRMFRYYKEISSPKDPLHKEVEREIARCTATRYLIKNPKNYTIKPLAGLNSAEDEYAPRLTTDGQMMYFTSVRERADFSNSNIINKSTGYHYEDMYSVNAMSVGEFSNAKLLELNTNENESVIGISTEGDRLFLNKGESMLRKIFVSENVDGIRMIPELLDPVLKTINWRVDAYINPDATVIVYAATYQQQKDIYMIQKDEYDTWGKPKRLPESINSPESEETPFITNDGNRIYFSSKGHSSMGGFDIFYSDKTQNGWSTPVNMGYPLNSVLDELHFVLSNDDQIGYFSSNQTAGQGGLDLYIVDLLGVNFQEEAMPVEEFTSSSYDFSSVSVLELSNLLTGKKIIYQPNSDDYGFEKLLDPCTKYEVSYIVRGRTMRKEEIFAPCGLQEAVARKKLGTRIMDDYIILSSDTLPADIPTSLFDEAEAATEAELWAEDEVQGELTYHFQIVVNNESYAPRESYVSYMNKKGKELFKELIDPNGKFTYHKLSGKGKYIFELSSPGLAFVCDQIRIVLIDSNDEEVISNRYAVKCNIEQ